MDAITLLKNDHRTVESLFDQIHDLPDNDPAACKEVFDQIARELTVHSKIEETLFYPALKAKARAADEEDAAQEVLEGYEEHGNVKSMIEKLKATPATDETYAAKLQVLSELVKHHVHEEEHEMFHQAHHLLNAEEREALGAQLEAAKETALNTLPV